MINNSIERIKNSRAVHNGIWLYIMQTFNSIIPLITLPYITRVLGEAGYGIFSKVFNIVGYLQVIIEYGFGMSGARKAAITTDKKELSRLFSAFIFVRALLLIICCVVSGAVILVMEINTTECICFISFLIMLIGTVFQQNWLFQGIQKMYYIAIISMVSRLISLIGIFSFVHSAEDVFLYCILYSSTSFCGGVFGTGIALFKEKLSFTIRGIYSAWAELKDGWHVFTTSLSSKVFGAFGITVLGIVASNAEIGVFSAIQKIPSIVMLAWMPISQILYPISSRRFRESFDSGKKFVLKCRRVCLLLFFAITVVIALGAKTIIGLLYGENYAGRFFLVYPLLLWLLLGINNNFWGIQILLASGHLKEYSKCFQISIVVLVAVNIIFINIWGDFGAAFAPALSELFLGILLYIEIGKIKECDV